MTQHRILPGVFGEWLGAQEARQWATRLREVMDDYPLSAQMIELLAFLGSVEEGHPVDRMDVKLRIAGCVGARRQSLAWGFV